MTAGPITKEAFLATAKRIGANPYPRQPQNVQKPAEVATLANRLDSLETSYTNYMEVCLGTGQPILPWPELERVRALVLGADWRVG